MDRYLSSHLLSLPLVIVGLGSGRVRGSSSSGRCGRRLGSRSSGSVSSSDRGELLRETLEGGLHNQKGVIKSVRGDEQAGEGGTRTNGELGRDGSGDSINLLSLVEDEEGRHSSDVPAGPQEHM
jgi:hypothetical protein